MKQKTPKRPIYTLIPILAVSALALPVCQAEIVFSDDFSEAPGTAIIGKSPDVGFAWTGNDNGTVVSGSNSLDSTGNGRMLFGRFTTALGAGQILTLTYDTLALSGDNFFSGWAGVSLYEGGNERVFTGAPGLNNWGVDGGGVGGQQGSGESTAITSAQFTYLFDTGAWTLTTGSGVNMSGIGTAGFAFDELRVANGNGADLNIDNLTVDISVVPEPASIALLGLGGFGFLLLRRRK